jgi:hypothetical protein
MAKAELKTKKTNVSAKDFLNKIKDEQQRKDSFAIVKMFEKVTGDKPEMWGKIIGFGNVTLKYESGRELDWFKTGFAPRKDSLTLYVLNNSKEQNELLKKLGKHKASGSCLHIKKLEDVDVKVLQQVIDRCAKK